VKALRELVGLARQGWSPALTPDGPRGPRYSVQPGFVLVARRCGLPVYPVGVAAEPAWEANSWDGTVVPYPGARVVIHVGEPLEPDDHPDRDEFCRVIGDAMQDACARAEDML
jgi:hypothetical protein